MLILDVLLCIVLCVETGRGTIAVKLVVDVMLCNMLCVGQEKEQ